MFGYNRYDPATPAPDAIASLIDQQLDWQHEQYALEPFTTEQQTQWYEGEATYDELARIDAGQQVWQPDPLVVPQEVSTSA